MVKFAGLLILVLSVAVCWGLPQQENYITNGNDAYAGQFPYFASVAQKLLFLKEQIKCGGAIVNKEWVLTSAQCVKPLVGTLMVKVGQSNRNRDGEYVQKRKVHFVIIHNEFTGGINPGIKENDIALLKLDKPLQFNARVQPIKIAEYECEPKEKVVLIGYGAITSGFPIVPKELQYAKVEVISDGLCRDAIASVSSANNGLLTDYHLCTGPLDKGITTCLGDLGDPLVRYDYHGKPELVGIAAWGTSPCGKKGSPIVYTKVSLFDYWIEDRIHENKPHGEH